MEDKRNKQRWVVALILSILYLSIAVMQFILSKYLLGGINLFTASLWITMTIIRRHEWKAAAPLSEEAISALHDETDAE